MKSIDRISYLFERYEQNSSTVEEKKELFQWFDDHADSEIVSEFFIKGFQSESKVVWHRDEWEPLVQQILLKLPNAPVVPARRSRVVHFLLRTAAAAAVVGIIALTWWLFFSKGDERRMAGEMKSRLKNDVGPGGNVAVLTLVDGSQIMLNDAANGSLAEQGGVKVSKVSGGMVLYEMPRGGSALSSGTDKILYNTISTPRGGQYQLLLADGTKVWLNAASSLRFPTSFGGKERRVELRGEAYFEVNHSVSQGVSNVSGTSAASRASGISRASGVSGTSSASGASGSGRMRRLPFIVDMINGVGEKTEVEVLGTHFNINSYENEDAIKTTLLEGSVKVVKGSDIRLLKPGQQAIVKMFNKNNNSDPAIKVNSNVDVEQIVAWKDGLFHFNNTPMLAVIHQIERWYDVEVIYDQKLKPLTFSGVIGRMSNLSDLLRVIETTGVMRFEVDGKKIHAYEF